MIPAGPGPQKAKDEHIQECPRETHHKGARKEENYKGDKSHHPPDQTVLKPLDLFRGNVFPLQKILSQPGCKKLQQYHSSTGKF